MKIILQQKIVFVFCILILFVFQTKCFAGPGNYTWKGVTSTSWTTAANWDPNGVPSTNDTVTIVAASYDVSLSGNITVKKFTITSGKMYLNDFTLTITTHATFTSGTITAGAGRLVVSAATSATFSGTTFSVPTTITSNSVYLNGSIFNDSLTITKNGNSNDNSKGGNTYKKVVLITNSNKGAFVLSDSFPDVYEKKIIVKNTYEGAVYLAHRATGNVFKDDVTLYGKNIYSNYYGTAEYLGNITLNCPAGNVYFGYGTGSSTLANNRRLQLGDSVFAAGKLYLMHFTKTGTEGDFSLALTGSATLTFETGTVINSTVTTASPTLYLHGTRFNNTADLTVTGTSTASSEGGCYFAADAKITNNSSGSNSFALGNTVADTFATTSAITNTKGTMSMNNAVFVGNTVLKNVETSTNSDRFIVASTGNCVFQGNIQINNSVSGFCFGKTSGTTSLASGKTLTFVSGFSGNITLKNFSQLGSTAQSFSFTSTSQKLITGPGTTFNGNFNFTGHFIILNGTTFNGTADITRYGSGPDTCGGGNVFNSTTVIRDSSSSAYAYLMAYTNPDDFNGNVTFVQKGSGAILYPAYNKNSTFAGNISIVSASQVIFGNNGGKVILDGTGSQTLSSSTAYTVKMKKLQINKASNAFTLSYPLTISDSLFLTKGRILTDTTNFLSMAHGSKLSGGNDSSYVNGPMKKIGNSAFVFPLGSSSLTYPYHPMEISAPFSTTDAFIGNYFSTGQSLGSISDTSVDNLNSCQYWKLTRDVGTSKVKVKLSWNHDSCEVLSPVNMRIVAWNDSIWDDIGNSACSGDSILGGTQSTDSVTTKVFFTLAFKKCIAITKYLSQVNVQCKGAGDGRATVIVNKGTPDYAYSWSNGKGIQNTTPLLLPGKYFVTIVDGKECNLIDSVIINEPDSMTLSFATSPSNCSDSTGIASVLAIGGLGNFSYRWTYNGTKDSILKDVPAGIYSVVVSDSIGCKITGIGYIENTDGPGMNILSQINPSCFGLDSGSVEIEGADSKSPFTYIWSRFSYDTLASLSNLRAGIYVVKIINNEGCVSFDSITITQPDTFSISLSITGTPCGNSVGEIVASVKGGIYPLTYSWSSLDTDSIASNLSPGNNTLVVTDANGCQISSIGEVESSSGFEASSDILSNVICFPDSGGSASISITGGTGPFMYDWYPTGGIDSVGIDLPADNYIVTITDSNGCKTKTTFSISSPPQLVIDVITIDPTEDSLSNGKALALVYGGTSPYTFLWSDSTIIDSITDLSVGSDTVWVTDANGCNATNISLRKPHVFNSCWECRTAQLPFSYCGLFTPPDCAPSCVTVNIVTDFHADGTDEISDECQFEAAVSYLSSLPPETTKELIIPPGIYLIGRQDPSFVTNPNDFGLYGHSVLCFQNISNLSIFGKTVGTDRAILKFENCLRYGAFDIPNGNPDDRFLGDFTNCQVGLNYKYLTFPGIMIHLNGCSNIQIKNLELDGNIHNLIIGGGVTAGMQLVNDGIFTNASNNVALEDLYIHDFGQDGIRVYYDFCPSSLHDFPRNPPIMNMIINRVNSSFNGRNGLTWAGGSGMTVTNSEFSSQGLNPIFSLPGAGVDIEFENSNVDIANGIFQNCQFRFNAGYGLVSDAQVILANDCSIFSDWSMHAYNFRFYDCTFVGGQSGSPLRPNSRGFYFNHCHFFGQLEFPYISQPSSLSEAAFDYSNVRFENHCDFNEIYPLAGNNYSFAVTPDESTGCPVAFHYSNLEFPFALRIFMTNCQINSNYTSKSINLSGGRCITPSSWNRSKIINSQFRNYGLNGCSCDLTVASINHASFPDPINYSTFSYFIGYPINFPTPPCGSITYLWNPGVNLFGTFYGGAYISPTLFVNATKWLDNSNYLTLRSIPCTTEAVVFNPPCSASPNRSKPSTIESPEMELFPNPTSESLTITNLKRGEMVSIRNVYGSIVASFISTDEKLILSLSIFDSGVYFIYTSRNKVKSFVKL